MAACAEPFQGGAEKKTSCYYCPKKRGVEGLVLGGIGVVKIGQWVGDSFGQNRPLGTCGRRLPAAEDCWIIWKKRALVRKNDLQSRIKRLKGPVRRDDKTVAGKLWPKPGAHGSGGFR